MNTSSIRIFCFFSAYQHSVRDSLLRRLWLYEMKPLKNTPPTGTHLLRVPSARTLDLVTKAYISFKFNMSYKDKFLRTHQSLFISLIKDVLSEKSLHFHRFLNSSLRREITVSFTNVNINFKINFKNSEIYSFPLIKTKLSCDITNVFKPTIFQIFLSMRNSIW